MKFNSFDRFELIRNGATDAFVVANPSTCENFDHIIGKVVEMDGAQWEVVGVDRFAHCAPWHEGERIALIVRAVPAVAKVK